MAIQTFNSLAAAREVADPKTIVSFGDVHVVYTEEDLETPPKNPAEGE